MINKYNTVYVSFSTLLSPLILKNWFQSCIFCSSWVLHIVCALQTYSIQKRSLKSWSGLSSCWETSTNGICWGSSRASCGWFRKLLECIEGKFLSQVIDIPAKGDMIPDLLLPSTSELIGDIKNGISRGCSDPALVEIIVLGNMGQADKVRPLNFGKAKFLRFNS